MKNMRYVWASLFGNMLEWYDFALFGLTAPIFSQLFFPKESTYLGLMASFAIFAVGYFMRPLGGLIAGHFGDKYSRKSMLILTILTMGISTSLVGLLPTYYQAGLLAPLLLLLIRLLQGLAVGGEFPGSIVLMYETSPKYKSVVITLVICGAMIGFFIATFLVAYFSKHMPHQQYLAWGWRVPFLLGIVLAIFGLYLRLKVFKDLLQKNTLRHRIPVLHLLKTHPKELIRGIIWMMVPAAYSAFFSVYVTTFLTKNLHYDYSFAVKVVMMILIVMMLSLLFSSYIVDKYKIYWQSLRWGAVAALVCTYPLFKLMTLGHGATIIALIALLLVYSFTVSGPVMYVLNLIFPASMRYTGVALSHSIGTGVFIGVSPMIYTWLAHNFGAMAVSAWFYVVVVLMLIALYKVGSKNLTS